MSTEIKDSKRAWSVLIVSTLAFTVCFMVWMMFGVIGIPIKKMLNLNDVYACFQHVYRISVPKHVGADVFYTSSLCSVSKPIFIAFCL